MPFSSSVHAPVHPRRVVIAGGGTGGHLFPGIAVAERVRAEGGEAMFVGTARGIEAKVLPRLGWKLELIDVAGLKGRGAAASLRVLLRLPHAWWQCRRLLISWEPTAVLGVGGYASGPMVMTAWAMGIPTLILEQNSVPGITNRWLGRVVRRVCTMFPDLRGAFPAHKVVVTGNPVRAELVARLHSDDVAAHGRSARLFVFGGSQGARPINDAMIELAPKLAARVSGFELWHQTGEADRERVQKAYDEAGLSAEQVRVMAFIDDMASAYAWSDVVLCRAGATSLAELTFAGRGAVLVPLPHAADNHQEHNARAVVEAGAAELVVQRDLTARQTEDQIVSLLTSPDRLVAMGAAMRTLARPDAAAAVLAEVDAASRC